MFHTCRYGPILARLLGEGSLPADDQVRLPHFPVSPLISPIPHLPADDQVRAAHANSIPVARLTLRL